MAMTRVPPWTRVPPTVTSKAPDPLVRCMPDLIWTLSPNSSAKLAERAVANLEYPHEPQYSILIGSAMFQMGD